jgi:hypothetical protein
MSDKKITQLTVSTIPLVGTEVLPIVQSGVTKQVSVANLTVGRAVSATGMTLTTDNLVISTSGKGIDFSATPGAGTSELLNDYEEGTWTPQDGSSANLTFTLASGKYVKIGNYVFVEGKIVYPTTASGAEAIWEGLPFAVPNNGGGTTSYCEGAFQLFLRGYGGTAIGLVRIANNTTVNSTLSGATVLFTFSYRI